MFLKTCIVIDKIDVISKNYKIYKVICTSKIVHSFTDFVPFVFDVILDSKTFEDFGFLTIGNSVKKINISIGKLLFLLLLVETVLNILKSFLMNVFSERWNQT